MIVDTPTIRQICGWQLIPIENEEPSTIGGRDILAYTGGCGFRIIRYNPRLLRWENIDGSEDRLAIHKWCYLG